MSAASSKNTDSNPTISTILEKIKVDLSVDPSRDEISLEALNTSHKVIRLGQAFKPCFPTRRTKKEIEQDGFPNVIRQEYTDGGSTVLV